MAITPESLIKADLNITSEENVNGFLRIKYYGKTSDSACDPIPFKIRTMRPETPVLFTDTDRTSIAFGQCILIFGGQFRAPIDDNPLPTEWYVYRDQELTDRVDVEFDSANNDFVQISQLLDYPTGDYYVTCRHIGEQCGPSKWATPFKFHWTNIDLSDDYFTKQETAFDLIKAVATECEAANKPSAIDGLELVFNELRAYERAGLDPMVFSLQVNNGLVTHGFQSGKMASIFGHAYADTMIFTISSLNGWDGVKKGCFMVNKGADIHNVFDLDATGGKAVFDYDDGVNQYWVAYQGTTMKAGGKFYYVKKVSSLRRNIEVVL